MSKRNKQSTKRGIHRHNISLDPVTRERGEALANEDKRSFSNLLVVLIDTEWQRRQGKQAA
jgi:hypothetical protein